MPTILEELEALVGKDAAAKIAAQSDLATRLTKGQELYKFYTEGTTTETEEETAEEKATREAAEKTERERVAAAAAAARAKETSTTTSTLDNKSILSELTNLLDTRLTEFKKTLVTTDQLPGLEGTLLSKALKTSHELTRIENGHKTEFKEDLDLTALDTWVNEQKKAGANWPSITAAYNTWVQEKRVEARIAAGIAEGLKNKTSSTELPGQTTSMAMSPAQHVLHEARKTTTTGEKSNAMKAAEKLAALERSRTETAA